MIRAIYADSNNGAILVRITLLINTLTAIYKDRIDYRPCVILTGFNGVKLLQ